MGKIYNFRNHDVMRTCTEKFDDYHKYRSYLVKDFHHRCAYCNMLDELITTPFEIDHFVPKSKFKEEKESMLTDYENLMYSCKKCNRAKSNLHEGTLEENELFFNAAKEDLNEFFYIQNGIIQAKNEKAENVIKLLKLYRPIHQLAWVVEKLNVLIYKVGKLKEVYNNDDEVIGILKMVHEKLAIEYHTCENVFKHYFNTQEQYDFQIKKSCSNLEEALDNIGSEYM